MFYQQQPLLLNSSYPLNLPNTNYYSNDYSNETNAYDAQPIPQPRKLNQTQYQQHIIQQKANLASQQSNRSFDSSVKQLNSPTSFDGDNEEVGKDDSVLIRAYENQKTKDKFSSSSQPQQQQQQQHQQQQQQQNQSSNKHEDELKRQKIWDKLQRANKDIRSKNSSQVNTARKPPTGQNTTGRKRNAPGSYLPPEQLGMNFVETNVNAIKNKENLLHRYPLKTYEVMHKKMEQLK
jgi:G3E family GTPase